MRKQLILSLLILTLIFFTYCTEKTNIDNSEYTNTPDVSVTIPDDQAEDIETPTSTEISIWTFPIGDFGNGDTLEKFIENFNELHPEIKVNFELLDFSTGDAKVEAAIENRNAPDIIMEGPERLVANWGARGLMIDLKDLWDDETKLNISKTSNKVIDACSAPDGAYYLYPLAMTAHVMAINYEVFEKAGALKYIDEETRTWTTDDFISAMETIRDSGLVEAPGVLYTGSQGGDQGTRALVTNLYGAEFTNEDHNAYTINDELGIKGLTLLQNMVSNESLSHNSEIAASEELQMFAAEKIAITLAWNATNESLYAEQVDFTPFAMNFPSDDGIAELQGGIWGFGIFNNGDMKKLDASMKLIKFLCDDPEQRQQSIIATEFFPVNSAYSGVYIGGENEERMATYASFMPYLGDYYQVTLAWPAQRTEWYKMLQQVFSGADAQETANTYVQTLEKLIDP